MTHMFGNPGTVEQGFLDSLGSYADFEYILSLQETVAVGMADGYARATRRPTAVQLHSGVGLGNGIGMLYQAKRGHSPLVPPSYVATNSKGDASIAPVQVAGVHAVISCTSSTISPARGPARTSIRDRCRETPCTTSSSSSTQSTFTLVSPRLASQCAPANGS